MIVDLQSLIAPLSLTEFSTLLRERTLAHLRGSGPNRFATLLEWNTLNHLIETGIYPLDRLRVQRESIPIPAQFYAAEGRIRPAALAGWLDQGASVIFNRLDHYVPHLNRLCRAIAGEAAEEVTANAIVTSGKGGAISKHFDHEDIAILQIAGTKRWQVFGPPVINPVKGMAIDPPPQGGPHFDEVLQPGDWLFLPAGYWHHCENGPDRSLHVGITFEPPCGQQWLTAMAAELLSDETFRRPLTRLADPAQLADHEAALKRRLGDKLQTMSLADYLANHAAAHRSAGAITLEGTSGATAGDSSRRD
jgi:hypothetical protein